MSEFKVGDRVKVKAEEADYYLQPWRDRFNRGVEGTVTGVRPDRHRGTEVFVQFHPKRKPKREADWKLAVTARDLQHAEPTHER